MKFESEQGMKATNRGREMKPDGMNERVKLYNPLKGLLYFALFMLSVYVCCLSMSLCVSVMYSWSCMRVCSVCVMVAGHLNCCEYLIRLSLQHVFLCA